MRIFARKTEITSEEVRAAEAHGSELAQYIIANFGTTDVSEIAYRAGARIVYQRWPLVTIGEYEPRTTTIRVNIAALERAHDANPPSSPELLSRAIIAHELGHLFTARLNAGRYLYKEHLLNERMAHSFAVTLLSASSEISNLTFVISNQPHRANQDPQIH